MNAATRGGKGQRGSFCKGGVFLLQLLVCESNKYSQRARNHTQKQKQRCIHVIYIHPLSGDAFYLYNNFTCKSLLCQDSCFDVLFHTWVLLGSVLSMLSSHNLWASWANICTTPPATTAAETRMGGTGGGYMYCVYCVYVNNRQWLCRTGNCLPWPIHISSCAFPLSVIFGDSGDNMEQVFVCWMAAPLLPPPSRLLHHVGPLCYPDWSLTDELLSNDFSALLQICLVIWRQGNASDITLDITVTFAHAATVCLHVLNTSSICPYSD